MGDKVPDHGSIPSIWIIPKKNFLKNKSKKSNIVVWPCSVCLVYFVKMPIAGSILGPNLVVRSSDQNMPVRRDISYPKESRKIPFYDKDLFFRFARSVRILSLSTPSQDDETGACCRTRYAYPSLSLLSRCCYINKVSFTKNGSSVRTELFVLFTPSLFAERIILSTYRNILI